MSGTGLLQARRTRVLQVVLDLEAGGLERLVADLIRLLDRERFESHLLTFGPPGRYAKGLEAYATLHRAVLGSPFSMLWPRGLAEQIRSIAPDVVHSHSGVWYKASLAARLARVPRVIHTDHGRHHPDPLMDRLVDAGASRRTTAVVAVSEALASQLAKTVVGDPRRIRVIPNGVDTELFCSRKDSATLRQELGLEEERPILGSIGRFDRIKGYDILLDAYALLLEEWPAGSTPALLLAGEGPEEGSLREQTQALPPRAFVRFLGWRNDVGNLLSSFSLFTLASRSEGTSVSLLEAMSSECCPVVTDVGGNAVVLGPDLSHRLVPSADPRALASAWRLALSDPEACTKDAALARTRVQTQFSLHAMVRAYEDLYEGDGAVGGSGA